MDMGFQQRLNRLRRERGLSQEDLAEVVGVTRQAVQKWESGASRPDMDNLAALARYFGVTLDYLVLGEEAAPSPAEPRKETEVHHYYHRWEYEYKSERTLFGLPLVHIHFRDNGFAVARGVFAAGNVAVGLAAVGVISCGLFSLGCVALGLLAAGALAAGVAAIGGVAVGFLAWGGLALGWLAFGGLVRAVYGVGGVVSAARVAIGDVAMAPLAIGDAVEGTQTIHIPAGTMDAATMEIVRAALDQALAGGPAWLRALLWGAARGVNFL